ncbi:MAG: adenosine deaminase [Propionibacteriales bacterium]|nr:adenosine deaminase [Propionibacteriales bacterium]
MPQYGSLAGRRTITERVATLPKAELHLHLEGTLEPELIFELAARNRVRLPYASVDDLRRRYAFTDLQSFLDLYYANMRVLRTAQDFRDLTTAYLARARQAGVRHAEVFFDPQAHTSRGVPLAEALAGVTEALSDSEREYGVSTGLVVTFLRDLSADSAMSTLESVLDLGSPVLGVGLDSAEMGHPPAKFAEVFARARAEGLRCVAHAGEEGPPEYITDALDVLRVERIDHGVRCLEDDGLVERLVRDRIPLTVCPLSNVRLRVVDDLAAHPIVRMRDRGLLVSVNSDDPSYFGGYVDENYGQLAREFGLDASTLAELARNSFESAFLEPPRRDALLAEVAAWRQAVT